jgi:predicted nucleotidyltransferase
MENKHKIAIDEAIDWIRNTFNAKGIVVTGTIIRGNPGAHSDLDIFVVHEERYRQRIQKFFSGIPCEIFVNNLDHIYTYFETEYKDSRPVSAHMLATGMVVLGRDDEDIQKLIHAAKDFAAKSPILDHNRKTGHRYRIATLFEDATDLKDNDPVTCLYFLNRVVGEALDFLFINSNQPLPRAKERIRQIKASQPEMGRLIIGYFEAEELNEKYAIAKTLIEESVGATSFFEWDSERS